MEKISPQVRIMVVVLVLVGVAGMLALRMIGPSAEPIAVPAAVTPPASPKPAAKPSPKPAARTQKAAAKPAAQKPAAKPAAKPAPAPVVPAVPPSGFPAAVDKALRKHEVVVLSLVVPGARVDELAAAEARAGAEAGGVGYLALNVLNEGVARALLTKLDGLQDPSLVVVKRPGEIVLQLPGFVDRETVAQAAANASS